MPKYLWKVSYTNDGVKGLLHEGGTSRREVVTKLCAELGGNLEAFYYAFGDVDAYIIAELPDNVSASAISLQVAAAGGAVLKTVPLVTCEEIDAATKQSVAYRPPS